MMSLIISGILRYNRFIYYNTMMYTIGLTGNIGAGKSTVLRFFQNCGAATISADDIARQLTAPGEPALLEIRKYFNDDVILQDGSLDRKKLRAYIVHSPQHKIWLENLLHPLIRQKIKDALDTIQGPYCIVEIPLLFDKADYPYLNRILLVQASEEIQVQRIMARDQCTFEQASKMLALQPKDAQRLSIADDVIINDRGIDECERTVKTLDLQYRKAA